eukprot:g828.t1
MATIAEELVARNRKLIEAQKKIFGDFASRFQQERGHTKSDANSRETTGQLEEKRKTLSLAELLNENQSLVSSIKKECTKAIRKAENFQREKQISKELKNEITNAARMMHLKLANSRQVNIEASKNQIAKKVKIDVLKLQTMALSLKRQNKAILKSREKDEKRIATLEKMLSSLEKEKQLMKEKHEDEKQELRERLEAEHARTEKELEETKIRQIMSKVHEEESEWAEEKRNLEHQIEEEEGEISSLKKENQTLTIEKDTLTKKLSRASENNKVLQGQLAKTKEEIKNLLTALGETEKKLTDAKKDEVLAKEELEKLQKQMKRSTFSQKEKERLWNEERKHLRERIVAQEDVDVITSGIVLMPSQPGVQLHVNSEADSITRESENVEEEIKNQNQPDIKIKQQQLAAAEEQKIKKEVPTSNPKEEKEVSQINDDDDSEDDTEDDEDDDAFDDASNLSEILSKTSRRVRDRKRTPSVQRVLDRMQLSAFLKSIFLFQTLSDTTIAKLAEAMKLELHTEGKLIIKHGDIGDKLYILWRGTVEVFYGTEDNATVIETLCSTGEIFGERALIYDEPRTGSCRVKKGSSICQCFVLSKKAFRQVIDELGALSGGVAFLDYSQNRNVQTLAAHLDKYFEHVAAIKQEEARKTPDLTKIRCHSAMCRISAVEVPEASGLQKIDFFIHGLMDIFPKVDKIGFFLVNHVKKEVILIVSKFAKGVKMKMSGIAGNIAMTGESISCHDAYKSEIFDSKMDDDTGYHTQQLLGMPIKDGGQGKVMAVVQLINIKNVNGDLDKEANFDKTDQIVLKTCCQAFTETLKSNYDRLLGVDEDTEHTISAFQIEENYLINVSELQIQLQDFDSTTLKIDEKFIKVSAQLFMGNESLEVTERKFPIEIYSELIENDETKEDQRITHLRLPSNMDKGGNRIQMKSKVKNVPRGSRFIIVCSIIKGDKEIPLAWAGYTSLDSFFTFRQGEISLHLWPGNCEDPTVPDLSATRDSQCGKITMVLTHIDPKQKVIQFRDSASDVVQTERDPMSLKGSLRKFNDDAMKLILQQSPLYPLSTDDKLLVWTKRKVLVAIPEALPKFLQSTDWRQVKRVQEAYQYMHLWEKETGFGTINRGLQLLGKAFQDPTIRAFGVFCLRKIDDEQLNLYLLQLVQALKWEPSYDSALSRFLLRRAISNTNLIGHNLFWMLKAEIHLPMVQKRFGFMMNTFMKYSGSFKISIGQEQYVLDILDNILETVKHMSQSGKEEKEQYHRSLEMANKAFPPNFDLPIHSENKLTSVQVEKCRVMSSKMKPLWLEFLRQQGSERPLGVLYKVGDDLRQDQLVLQLIRVFDSFWQANGLHLSMSPYRVVCTGQMKGMLEVVRNATPLNAIISGSKGQVKKTKTFLSKVQGISNVLWNKKAIKDWLNAQAFHTSHRQTKSTDTGTKQSKTRRKQMLFHRRTSLNDSSPFRKYNISPTIDNFVRSCAGYCAATYVLGVGDRHSDNIMINNRGLFFHIDFGHFLGNFKSKLGIKRERTPFVFTKQMREVMTLEDALYQDFLELSKEAFLVIRRNANLVLVLLSLMTRSGIPELRSDIDLKYVENMLMLDIHDENEAGERYKNLIVKCENDSTRQLDHTAHFIKHA